MSSRPDGADVIVVGAGIIGCAVAYRLSRSGLRVIVVDAGTHAGTGTTGASSALVRFHYSLRDTAAMAWDSYHAWTDWQDELAGVDPDGMIEYRTTGGLLLGEPSDFEPMVANFDSLDIAHEVLDANEISVRFPAIDPSRFGPPCRFDDPGFGRESAGTLHGLFTPAAGYISDPQLAARNYKWAAEQHGARFVFRTRVTGVNADDECVSNRIIDKALDAGINVIDTADVCGAGEVTRAGGS